MIWQALFPSSPFLVSLNIKSEKNWRLISDTCMVHGCRKCDIFFKRLICHSMKTVTKYGTSLSSKQPELNWKMEPPTNPAQSGVKNSVSSIKSPPTTQASLVFSEPPTKIMSQPDRNGRFGRPISYVKFRKCQSILSEG